MVGSTVGSVVGSTVGSVVGSTVGSVVGSTVGSVVGSTVGSVVGTIVTVGVFVGAFVGALVGSCATTFTVQVAFFLPSIVVTVILAVPFFKAFTFPFALTVAIFSLLEANTTAFEASFGFTVTFKVKLSPGFTVFSFTLRDTLFTDFFATYTVITCFAPFATPLFPVTVILAVPAFFPVTTPLELTEATLFLLDLNFNAEAFTLVESFNVFPLFNAITA